MNTPKIAVAVIGAFGKMGQETCKTLRHNPQYELCAKLGRKDNITQNLAKHKPDIAIDFTTAHQAFSHANAIIKAGVRPLIGTSGLTVDEITILGTLCKQKKLGGIIAPNFSIGAILMMHFSEIAAKFLPNASIIETHHEKKKDAPSGTSLKTAELIDMARNENPCNDPTEVMIPGALGTHPDDTKVPIHSLRLPGFIAQQEVIFGSTGEHLKIVHSSIHREGFMPGVLFALQEVMLLDTLVYGLESLLFKT